MVDNLYRNRPRRIRHFERQVVSVLQGETPELRPYRDRLDFHGVGALLDLYDGTSGRDRIDIIRAMGKIVATAESRKPETVSQVVYFAASVDISQIAHAVDRLSTLPIAQSDPVKIAVEQYQAFRKLAERPLTS